MSPENDQTKWRGIRPTNPAENIPVDGVRPGGTISHLQMVKVGYSDTIYEFNKDCSVSHNTAMPAVPANEIYVITNLAAFNGDDFCDISFVSFISGDIGFLKSIYSIPPKIRVDWQGFVVLSEDDYVYAQFALGGAVNDIQLSVKGYIIGVY